MNAILITLALLAAPPAEAKQPDPLDALIRKIVLDLIPHEYEDKDDWGQQKSFTTGVEFDLDGLRVDTERKKKELNHGTWQRYRVKLADEEKFSVEVNNLHQREDGKTAFNVEVALPVKAHARQARWQRGVQLYSISADAKATIKVKLECETSIQIDTTKFIPSMRLKPHVSNADIQLSGFKLESISKLHGDPAKQLGDAFEGRIAKIVAQKDEKLVKKINEKLGE